MSIGPSSLLLQDAPTSNLVRVCTRRDYSNTPITTLNGALVPTWEKDGKPVTGSKWVTANIGNSDV